jgi:sensor histidine kinase YesM
MGVNSNSITSAPHTQHRNNWFIRYKLYHIPFWCLYHYLWGAVTIGNPVKAASAIFLSPYGLKYSFYVVFQMAAVYFNLYYLMPRYLETNRLRVYISWLLAIVLATTLCIVGGYYFTAFVFHRTTASMFGDTSCFWGFFGTALPSTLASMTLAMSIKLTKHWIQTKRRQQLLEKEKLETELQFLKYQFNPHFLFNTINSIFFLIHKNPHMASASLAKFSDLLRYQLYECNDVQIPLSKEIAYLENFIELEKLRQNNNVTITVAIDQYNAAQVYIAPFILMTFVENAFKHVSTDTHARTWITIHAQLNGTRLNFSVSNSTGGLPANKVVHYGGIGLRNVQRRLDLLYPEQYTLNIQHTKNTFEVQLQLQLSGVTTIEKMPLTVPQPVSA